MTRNWVKELHAQSVERLGKVYAALGGSMTRNEDVILTAQALMDPDNPPLFGKSKPMDSAPKDGTMLCLLVDYGDDNASGDNPLEDARYAWTIGFNQFDHTEEDEWQFAGWNWSQDCFTEGRGKPIGWMIFDPQAEA